MIPPISFAGKPSARCDSLREESFCLFSAHASAVELCLFETPEARRETARVQLCERTDGVWHGSVPGLKAGQLYGFRVSGAYEPEKGHFFNPAKLLLDPYARAITGPFAWCDDLYGYVMNGSAERTLREDNRDSAAAMPKCVVVDDAFDWGATSRPETPLTDSVIYEVHVKGFSQLATELPPEERGTYAAMGSDWAITHLQRLGVTAVELLPVQHFVNDRFLEEQGLRNYWGYNPIGFFAPHAVYAAVAARAPKSRSSRRW